MGFVKFVFQSFVLLVVNKLDLMKLLRVNIFEIKKLSKVYFIDYDVNLSNKKWVDLVLGILDEVIFVIILIDLLKKFLSFRFEGLVVFCYNKVYLQKLFMLLDVQLVFIGVSMFDYEMQQENKEDLIEFNGFDNKILSLKYQIGLDDQLGISIV